MAVGQFDKKLTAIIQARMKSERLPGKILLPLPYPNGRPMMWWILNGVRQSKLISQIVLASSLSNENDVLEPFCAENSLTFFRGSETDVLSRFLQIIDQYRLDIVVRLTGDNPIVDSALLDFAILQHIANDNDYTNTTGLPLGMNFEIISARALLSIEHCDLTDAEREHVTLYIRNSTSFKKEEIRLMNDQEFEKVRLTVDYPSDLATLSLVFSLVEQGKFPNISLIEKIKNDLSWIFEINGSNIQKQQFRSTSEEIEAAVKLLEKCEFNQAARILASRTQ